MDDRQMERSSNDLLVIFVCHWLPKVFALQISHTLSHAYFSHVGVSLWPMFSLPQSASGASPAPPIPDPAALTEYSQSLPHYWYMDAAPI